MKTSQEHFTTIVNAKFGGEQSELWRTGKMRIPLANNMASSMSKSKE